MKHKLPTLILGASLLFASVSAGFSQTTNSFVINNYSFETPAVAKGGYEDASLPNWGPLISGSAVYDVIHPGANGSDLTTSATTRQISRGIGNAYNTFTGNVTSGTLTFTANLNSGQYFDCVNGFQLLLSTP